MLGVKTRLQGANVDHFPKHQAPDKLLKNVVAGCKLWHGERVKTFLSRPPKNSVAVDAEVRQIHAAGKRIAADKKAVLRFLAATGMYTTDGKLKPQFR